MQGTEIKQCGGSPGGECFLLLSKRSAILIDSGFSYSAPKTADNIQKELNGKRLDYILLSHSHYDHAGGSGLLRERFPGAKVVAHAYAAKIFSKESAKALMRHLNANAAEKMGMPVDHHSIDVLHVDTVVEHNDRVKTADLSIRAFSTPGHTQCSTSYYIEELDLLCTSETSGVAPNYPTVMPAFISSYQATLKSIELQEKLKARHLHIPHQGILSGADAEAYFAKAREAAEEHAEFVLDAHRSGCNAEEIVKQYSEKFYTDIVAQIQPKEAFVINTQAMIPRLLQEMAAVGRI